RGRATRGDRQSNARGRPKDDVRVVQRRGRRASARARTLRDRGSRVVAIRAQGRSIARPDRLRREKARVSPGPSGDPGVDELRQRLRALGYLDGTVDRFVLGSLHKRRRPAAIALLASTRVGMLAGVLLGPAAAVGMSGRLPGLVTGPRDAVVMAVYLAA